MRKEKLLLLKHSPSGLNPQVCVFPTDVNITTHVKHRFLSEINTLALDTPAHRALLSVL